MVFFGLKEAPGGALGPGCGLRPAGSAALGVGMDWDGGWETEGGPAL